MHYGESQMNIQSYCFFVNKENFSHVESTMHMTIQIEANVRVQLPFLNPQLFSVGTVVPALSHFCKD